MSRLLPALLALALVPVLALAQLRAIPAEAKRGVIRHLSESIVTIDGERARLAPGATIRDQHNRFIVPMALPAEGAPADYLAGADGTIFRVWLLTAEEQARPRPQQPSPSRP